MKLEWFGHAKKKLDITRIPREVLELIFKGHTYGTTQKKIVHPDTGRQKEDRKKLQTD
jgi:hypothetical protein